jgi:hypothetical protein
MTGEPTTPDWYDSRFDPYCLAVGRIAGIWAQMEFIINQAIWELMEVGAGACLTAQIVVITPGCARSHCVTRLPSRTK